MLNNSEQSHTFTLSQMEESYFIARNLLKGIIIEPIMQQCEKFSQ